jgi:pseudouridine-5'-phosphate glycosidase
MMEDVLWIAPEVQRALTNGLPVVALESSIITHGMPYPENLATARSVEGVVRAHGAVPATIALLAGRIHIGLDDGALAALAQAREVAKAGRRDLAPLLHRHAVAGTTVAATMYIAATVHIGVFATGGVGGVHRGAETSFDISADLVELATTPVVVVCAGVKSILDIPKTLEFLETHGVLVLGYGTNVFPAFFARESGAPIEHRVDTPEALAAVIGLHRRLGGSGVLVANPIATDVAMPQAAMEACIAAACREAATLGVTNKALTPFLLARVSALTEGRSLAANIALVRNNAALAAKLAVLLTAGT